MGNRKRPFADLERKRGTFFQIGLVVSLGLVLLAFDWKTHYDPGKLDGRFKVQEPEFLEAVYIFPEKERAPAARPAVSRRRPEPAPRIVPGIEPIRPLPDPPVIEPGGPDLAPPLLTTPEPAPAFVYGAEIMPKFPGGPDALEQWLRDNGRFPEECRRIGIDGTVYVSFVVDPSGKVVDIKLLRGVHRFLDREALRLMRIMPDWIPGSNGGHPVAVIQTQPIHFKLLRD
jgi:protein TonB